MNPSMDPSSLKYLPQLLELIGVSRNKEKPLFSPKFFKLYRVIIWLTFSYVVFASFYFVFNEVTNLEDSHRKMQALALGTSSLQFLVTNLIFIANSENFDIIVDQLKSVFHEIEGYAGCLQFMKKSDKQSQMFLRIFGLVIFSNFPTSMLLAWYRMYMSGRETYPLDTSVFGMPMALGWFVQMMTSFNVCLNLWCFYCVLKTIIYVLMGYSEVLAALLRARPIKAQTKEDRQILKLFCDINAISARLVRIYGIVAFIEVCTASGRCCFVSCQVLATIINKDYKNLGASINIILTSIGITFVLCGCSEDISKLSDTIMDGVSDSKWYAVSPEARKTLLPLLICLQQPVRLNYKRFMYFSMKTFTDVMKTTYTLTTALVQL